MEFLARSAIFVSYKTTFKMNFIKKIDLNIVIFIHHTIIYVILRDYIIRVAMDKNRYVHKFHLSIRGISADL